MYQKEAHSKFFSRLINLVIAAQVLIGCGENRKVDMIVHNAKIYCIDSEMNVFEAMAIKDGRIEELGPENQILNKYTSELIIDAQKKFIYPGFIDAHSHFLGYGLTRNQVDLIGTKSFQEALERIENFIVENDNPEWIMGRGWDQNDWEQKTYPDNLELESLFPDKKIVLKRVDGHAMLVSKSVLKLAGIEADRPIRGGEILVLENGLPSGILIDEAMTLVEKIIPEPSNELKTKALQLAEIDCFQVGLTSVCDAGLKRSEIELIHELQMSKQLKMRVYAMYSADATIMESLSDLGIKTERLTANSIKVYADGALGSRGAYLLNPYSDDSTKVGSLITPGDSLRKWAEKCYTANFQLNVHCIGDAANQITLDVMGEVLGGTNDRRWRIEHAQVVDIEDQSKFGTYNIVPSMQPTHATSDMYWAGERLGPERSKHAYALKSLLNQNGLVALGTDFPVESINPINTFYAAVIRKDSDGFPANGFQMEDALSRIQAIKGLTIWAAIANFEEAEKGSLESGKFADFILLDRDILLCNEEEILETKVLKTCLNGTIVYEK